MNFVWETLVRFAEGSVYWTSYILQQLAKIVEIAVRQ